MSKNNRSRIYEFNLDINNQNDSRKLGYDYVQKNSTVLDVGCACGCFWFKKENNKN